MAEKRYEKVSSKYFSRLLCRFIVSHQIYGRVFESCQKFVYISLYTKVCMFNGSWKSGLSNQVFIFYSKINSEKLTDASFNQNISKKSFTSWPLTLNTRQSRTDGRDESRSFGSKYSPIRRMRVHDGYDDEGEANLSNIEYDFKETGRTSTPRRTV